MRGLTDSTGKALPPSECPTPEQLRIYGEFAFLAFRSARHRQMDAALLQTMFEPPIRLGQYRIFRFDDVPRAVFTWGYLDHEAACKLVQGQTLSAEDWRSGKQLWITDLIAPYRGLVKSLSRWVMTPGNLTDDAFYFRRVEGANTTRKILEVDFRRKGAMSRQLSDADFAD